jgi:GMP synthase (glutamine-hydrolysing)
MKVAILQHEPRENAGFFEHIWKEQGIDYRNIFLYDTQEIPVLEETHLLVMGGSMSVHDEQEHPFLREEKHWIRNYVKRQLPVLGICLGAQLIADALGSSVYPYKKELGWAPIAGLRDVNPALFPRLFHAFQLHGDTFEIPAGGALLCSGTTVKNQAFSIGSSVGLQFHIEMTPTMIEEWTRDCGGQEKAKIRYDTSRYLTSSNRLCRVIGEWFLSHQNKGNS